MSNNYDITINDFGNICRTCLSREDLKPLYEKGFSSTCLADKLMSCTFVKFTEEDGLPVQICTNCIHEINQAFSFAKRCETTDTILRNCVKNFKPALANNCPPSQKNEPEEEMKIEIKSEFILPNIQRTEQEFLKDYNYVEEVTQEKDVNIEYIEEIKHEEELIIENVSDEPYQDHANDVYEENIDSGLDPFHLDETDSNLRRRSTNTQIKEDKTGSRPAKRKNNSKITSKPPYYDCKKCSEKFPDFKGLKKHREEFKHPAIAFSPCPFCNKIIGHGDKKRHMRTHTGEKPYSCEICGASFRQACHLNKHKRTQHSQPGKPIKDFQCKICNKAFTMKEYLKVHSLTHGEKKFVCNICKRGFARKDGLKYHSKIHTGERPHSCHVCGKSFSILGILKRHELIHTGEKPHVCSFCNKAFLESRALKFHIRLHTREKLHVCSICSKAFLVSSKLKVHMRMHTGEKPHVCSVCSKCFTTPSSLKVHMRTHTREKSFHLSFFAEKGLTNP